MSGAGDTFIAGLVRGYLDTQDIESAIEFAQECTTVVVQKHGVATVTLKEIQEWLKENHHGNHNKKFKWT